MKPSPRFSPRLRKALISTGIFVLFACGPGEFDLNEYLSYFLPETANAAPADRTYEYTPQLYKYSDEAETSATEPNQNTRAWHEYLGGKVPERSIAEALAATDPAFENAFTKYLSLAKPAALNYLRLALSADKALNSSEPWNQPTPDSTNASTPVLADLLAQASAGYLRSNDSFLKERYAFQAVKLAAQSGDGVGALRLFEQLVKPLPGKTFISDWALCRRAGVLLTQGDTAQAVLDFARVFDRCPTRRTEAERSLRSRGIGFRSDALALAQTDGERAAVYALCAIQPRQDALPYLEKLVELAPKNPLVELILAREINRNELFFLSTDNPIYAYDEATRVDSLHFDQRRQEAPDYASRLKEFALEAAENKALANPAFYLTAAAYLDYLAHNFASATTTLERATRVPTSNASLKKQIVLQQMLLLSEESAGISPEIEAKLIGFLEAFGNTENFRLNNAFVKVCQKFAARYAEQSTERGSGGWFASCSKPKATPPDPVKKAKAYLLTMLTTSQLNRTGAYFNTNTDQHTIEDTTSAATAQGLLAYAHRPEKTEFDQRLLKLTGFSDDYLYLLLGRRSLAEHRYAEAADALGKVSPKTWQAEPFTEYFGTDPLEVPVAGESGASNPYTPASFAKKMAELARQAPATTGDRAAALFYQLGCGAYNLSWHGNAWLLIRAGWSGSETSFYGAKPAQLAALARDPYYTTAPAKAYFEQALKAAKSPELAARACFMAARCEKNTFDVQAAAEAARRGYEADPTAFNAEMDALKKNQYSHFLSQLSQRYAATQFHRELLRECATYADFVAGR